MDVKYCGNYEEVTRWLYDELDRRNDHGEGSEFLVKMKWKYTGDINFSSGNLIVWINNEYTMCFLDDWWEGEQEIYVLGIMPVDDVKFPEEG